MKIVNTKVVKTGPAGGVLSEGMVLAPVSLGTMLAPLNSTMIAVAIPSLLEDFGRSLAWGSWIVASYLVAMAAVQPFGGALGAAALECLFPGPGSSRAAYHSRYLLKVSF